MSHQSAPPTFSENIHKMMREKAIEDFIIFSGGYEKTEFHPEKRLLCINCNDQYEGIPEKVVKMFSFVIQDDFFSRYTHFMKLDHDIKLLIPINSKKVANFHYAGVVNWDNIKRDYHIGRCSPGSYFNEHPYKGPFVPYCFGGLSYIMSRKAAEIIANNTTNFKHEIYEDLFIGKILKGAGIHPTDISRLLKKHVLSEEHSFLFNSFPQMMLKKGNYQIKAFFDRKTYKRKP